LSDGDVGIGDIISRMIRERTDPVVLVIGTGQIANHVLGRVHRKSCGRLVVAGRTPENVDLTARKYDAEPLSTRRIESILPECDVVISAVSVSEPLITGKMLSSESFINRGQGDQEESRLFIDLGMPANIERGISQSHQLILIHYEALEEQIRSTLDRRTLEVHKANLLIDEITEDYFSWLRSKELDPALHAVRQTLDSINLSGIEAFCNKKEAGKKSQEVEEYSRFITSEIMNMISRNIKSLTRNGADIEATDYLTKLFDTKSA
jgi:glutamyl-tRNA reductase